jgi:deazaflavin-dependent oxidoreductase (nitroreductase family)
MRRILESPIHWPLSRWFAVLSWTGRKSGRRYTTPISYVREGSTAWVTTGDKWWHNVVDGAPVRIRIAGRWRDGQATAVSDHAESKSNHERLFREHGWFRWLSGIPGDPSGGADPEAVERALRSGRVLVRIELRSGSNSPNS